MYYPVTSNLIAASAGTGKTYKLASRFISLLALDYPVEKLIALTFTRNAAGEFKGRILSALAEGARTPKGAAELTARIRETLGSDHGGNVPLCPQMWDKLELGQCKYRGLLRDMVDKLSRLNLATMDSFFTKLVSAHRYELGFPSLHQMDDTELEKVRQDSLKSLLYEAEQSDENTEAFMELCQDVSGNSKKDVFSILNENVMDYYPLYLDTVDESHVWGAIEEFQLTDVDTLHEIHKHLSDKSADVTQYIRSTLDSYDTRSAELLERLKDQGVKVNRNVEKGCESLSKKLLKGEAKISSTLCAWLYGDVRENADEETLRQLVRKTRDVVTLLPIVRKTLGMRNLMKCYDDKYREEVRDSGKLVFGDMPRLVADKLMNIKDAASVVAYRLDGQLDHWMLDEFQDTSPGQWAALKPLLSSIQSDVYQNDKQALRSIFVVGDEKQSIYGWRGATPELFTYLRNGDEWRKVFGITLQNESFRSAEAIMGEARFEDGKRLGFVNDLFSCIFCGDKRRQEEFARHRVSDSMRGKAGYVRVLRVTEGQEEGKKAREVMCEQIAATLDEIRYAQKKLSVAILVRTNTDVRAICQWFRDHRSDFPIMPLADETVGEASLLGSLFLHFFKWLQHPGDTYRENLLRHSSLRVMEDKSAPQAWNEWRRRLENEGYVRVLEMVTDGIELAQKDRIFREWVNEARAFESSGGTLDEWVRHIENHATKANPPQTYIHVMTFHKSKGTEYDVVFLPFNGVKAVNEKLAVLKKIQYGEGADKDKAYVRGVLVRPKIDDWEEKKSVKVPSRSPYNAVTRAWKSELMTEALNVLYVAVTRAKYANYIFLNGFSGLGKKAHADSYSDIFCRALAVFHESLKPQLDAPLDELLKLNEWGDPMWHESDDIKKKEAKGLADGAAVMPMPVVRARRRKVSPSKVGEEKGENLVVDASPIPQNQEPMAREAAASFGTAVHGLFEQVEWLGEGDEPEWVYAPKSEVERFVSAVLRVPEVQALYKRCDGQVAYNEQNIDAIQGDDWISGTLDRLTLTRREGKVVEASIIDFKTDIRHGSDAVEQDAHLRETHRAQMQAYHSLIAQALHLPAEAVSVILISCPRDGAAARLVRYATDELVR